ncbi:MAG: DUF6580 family putative transport protein [Gemmataceae bacterium]
MERGGNGIAWLLAVFAAGLTVVCRLIPYCYYDNPYETSVWHFVPIGALCVFAGARLRHPAAFLLPLAAMVVSDLLLIAPIAKLGYSAFGWGTPIRYGFLLVYFVGGWLIPSGRLAVGATATAAVLLLGGLPYFVVSNFLVWLGDSSGQMYSRDLAGLIHCYGAALPFYQNTLLADAFYGMALFGLHAVLLLAMRPQSQTQTESGR